MYIGADYYPEHWPQERWETDAQMMQAAGFNITRLAEFAWVKMEPQEGHFDFAWLDEALDVLARHDIQAILCTPTAVMPAWVMRTYPEAMAMQADGTRIVWGVRKNNCFTSGAYRLLSERITRAMAEHFKDTPNVVGWQTDNEFGNPVCYCETCRASFQDWLRAKYGTLAALNAAWGTHFWGHTFGTWGEIPIPVDRATHNPSACLDWQRFTSWLNVRFQRDQVRILREVCPDHFITHNFMGLFPELDYYELAEDLDHVSWDNYPVWGKPEPPYAAAAGADLMRGLKKQNFWIMEQTAGPGGWGSYGRNPRPGEIRKIAFQQVAHGADGMVWFRWRTCTAGREQYWHGLLGHDGKGLRRYREAAETATDLHQLSEALEGTTVKAEVAIIYDYDSLWAVRIQPGYAGNAYQAAMMRLHSALGRAGVNVDFVRPTDDLSSYRVVLAPDLYVMPDAVAQALSDYVAGGGILLTDSRSGVKDGTNLCHPRTLPGLLSDALGIVIEEYESLSHDWGRGSDFTYEAIATGDFANGEAPNTYTATQTAEWVQSQGAETLVGYTAWHMADFAALTRHRFGEGWGYFLGTVIEEPAFYDRLIADILERAEITPPLTPPSGVEVSVRENAERRLIFVINHTEEEQRVAVPSGKAEHLTGATTENELTLAAYGVAVIEW